MRIPIQTCLNLQGKTMPVKETYEMPHLSQFHKQLESVGRVTLEGKGYMQAGIFVVQGMLSGSYTLNCSRCLGELEVPFTQPFEERFNIDSPLATEDDNEEIAHEVEGNIIVLTPYVEEEVLVSIPFIPVHESEDVCEQYLPQEGKGWTIITETEKEEKVDPRLADLAKFFDSKKE